MDSAAARFAATVDLPSPGSGLVTTMTRGGLSMSMNCRLVRSLRNASPECTGSLVFRGPMTTSGTWAPFLRLIAGLAGMVAATVTPNSRSMSSARRSLRSSWLRRTA